MNLIDLTGKKYGRLSIKGKSGLKNKTKHILWNCECDCGNTITAAGTDLKTGNTKSCGCLRLETSSLNGTHRDIHTKEYRAWHNLKQRCFNPNNSHWDSYGGRGITVCDAWKNSYENFLNDMGRAPSSKHSIDRINNDGNYEPGNCRWATTLEQAYNKNVNIIITCYGIDYTIVEFCNILKIAKSTYHRYKKTNSVEQIYNKFKN